METHFSLIYFLSAFYHLLLTVPEINQQTESVFPASPIVECLPRANWNDLFTSESAGSSSSGINPNDVVSEVSFTWRLCPLYELYLFILGKSRYPVDERWKLYPESKLLFSIMLFDLFTVNYACVLISWCSEWLHTKRFWTRQVRCI